MSMKLVQITTGIGEDAKGKSIKNPEGMLKTVRKDLGKTFGGYTEVSTRGGWVNDSGRLVEEDTRTYQIATDAKRDTIITAARRVRDTMQQHSVFVVISNKAELV